MNLWQADRIMNRLSGMIDNAIEGRPIETGFDETKMSALETRLADYLAMTQTDRQQLWEEKQRIHELVSDISHQTKTPIANMMLYSQLLQEEELTEKQRDCVRALTEQAEKLKFLVETLVKTSRLETGIISVVPSVQPVALLLEAVAQQMMPGCREKTLSFSMENKNAELSAVYDFKWTVEALANIVDNAVKYTPEGGKIVLRAIAYEMFVRIDVIDNGIGIREEELEKIFRRFYRSEQVSSEKGVGLGLSLAREIVTREGGYIKVSSRPGQGAVFSVFLPREKKSVRILSKL